MNKNLKFNFQFSKSLKAIILLSLIAVSVVSVELMTQAVNAEHEIETRLLVAGVNTVSYRDVANTDNQTNTISINNSEFEIGDDVTIIVFDDAANLDPDGLDVVIANMSSTSSNGVTAFAILTEVIPNSATFTGVITLSSGTTTGSILEVAPGDGITVIYDPKDYPESARFQAEITTAGSGIVQLTDFFIDDSTKADTACPITPVTHAVDVNVSGTTASNILVTISYANALGVDTILNTPNFLKIGYRPTSDVGFEFLTPNGNLSGHDFFAKTVTNVLQPSSVNGQYVLGFELGCLGGGGGGLVGRGLVFNALAGVVGGGLGSGGGSAYSSPTLQLSNLVKLGIIDVPLEVEQMIYNHDSTVPATAFGLGFFGGFDYPLIINDRGFVLSGFETTIDTQSLETNTPHTFKFLFYESDKIQHFSLYMNLRDANTAIHQSDTQILFNDGQGIQIIDPNGFFESASLTLNEIDDIKKQVVLEITFANTMATTDMIVRSWDPFLNSFDTYILDAIEVVSDTPEESPTLTFEAPVIEELESQSIPKWIKNNAAWWSDQQISDSDFVSGIEYLIKNGIINVPGVEVGTSSATTEIPDWIQNNAGWWAESLITDGDFTEAMQWLIVNGVIQI